MGKVVRCLAGVSVGVCTANCNPRTNRSRRGIRSMAALAFACRKSGSGISIVVFIFHLIYILPYLWEIFPITLYVQSCSRDQIPENHLRPHARPESPACSWRDRSPARGLREAEQ